MKKLSIILTIIICLSLVLGITACSDSTDDFVVKDIEEANDDNFFNKDSFDIPWDDDLTIDKDNITAIGDKTKLKREYQDMDLYAAVIQCINGELMNESYMCRLAYAVSSSGDFNGFGVMYYNKYLPALEGGVYPCGFYKIVGEGEKCVEPFDKNEDIRILPVFSDEGYDDGYEKTYYYTYSCNNLLPGHFRYRDRYVRYELESPSIIRYKISPDYDTYYDNTMPTLYDMRTGSQKTLPRPYGGKVINGRIISVINDYMTKYRGLATDDVTVRNCSEIALAYVNNQSIDEYFMTKDDGFYMGNSFDALTSIMEFGNVLKGDKNKFNETKILTTNSKNWQELMRKINTRNGIFAYSMTVSAPDKNKFLSTSFMFTIDGEITAQHMQVVNEFSKSIIDALIEHGSNRNVDEAIKNVVIDINVNGKLEDIIEDITIFGLQIADENLNAFMHYSKGYDEIYTRQDSMLNNIVRRKENNKIQSLRYISNDNLKDYLKRFQKADIYERNKMINALNDNNSVIIGNSKIFSISSYENKMFSLIRTDGGADVVTLSVDDLRLHIRGKFAKNVVDQLKDNGYYETHYGTDEPSQNSENNGENIEENQPIE